MRNCLGNLAALVALGIYAAVFVLAAVAVSVLVLSTCWMLGQ